MDRKPSSTALKEFLTFPSITYFLYSKWRTIFLTFIIAATVSAVLAFVRQRTYEATATIVVLPPKFSTELNPEVLSIQTYELYFQSHAIIAEVLNAVPELEEGYTVEELSRDLRIGTLREKYGTEVKFSPLIMLHARANDPALAKKLADTWAAVASEKAKELLATGKQGVLDFINTQYSDLREKLVPAEEGLATTSTLFKDEILKTKNEWEQKIAVFKAMNNVDRLKAELEAMNKLVAESEAELAAIDLKVQVSEQTLAKARERQKGQQEKIKLDRSITESEIWRTLAQQGGEKLGDLAQIKLQNEEINPTYIETAESVEM